MLKGKVTVIGAGAVGAQAAYAILLRAAATEIVLYDKFENLSKGKTLEISQSRWAFPDLEGISVRTSPRIEESDIFIITAGLPRNPGESRDALLQKNREIVGEISREIRKVSQNNPIVIVVTNPLDSMVLVALKETGFPEQRVFGMGGLLDSFRLSDLECARKSVIGLHNESQVGLGAKEESRKAAAEMGARIIELTGRSSFLAPGAAIARLVELVLSENPSGEIVPLSIFLSKPFKGEEGICVGVPALLGRNGVQRIAYETKLSEQEEEAFHNSCKLARESQRGI